MNKEIVSLENEFVETICIEQGRAFNLLHHNDRMNRTRRAFWGDEVEPLRLDDYIRPESYLERTRCRVVYGRGIQNVEYFPYHMREVGSLRLVVCDEVDYSYKSTDRTMLNKLYEQRGEADDVLIVRNKLITDTSIANVALCDGDRWYTPLHPLLKGTCRQALLEEGKLRECDIRFDEIKLFSRITLFNAMIPFGTIEFETIQIE